MFNLPPASRRALEDPIEELRIARQIRRDSGQLSFEAPTPNRPSLCEAIGISVAGTLPAAA